MSLIPTVDIFSYSISKDEVPRFVNSTSHFGGIAVRSKDKKIKENLERERKKESKNLVLAYCHDDILAIANGVTSASGVGMGLGNGEVRQTGHVGCCRSHGSTHSRWNRWPHSGSIRSTSPSP